MADLSIIVTAYNIEDYIEQCLHSVAAQTLSDIEVLVVDDGSTDSTPHKITAFCAGDPRFVPVLLPENSPGGVGTAANAGLDRATGRWVGFVDGDDYVEPIMFERMVTAAETCDADLAMCDYQEVVDGSGERRDPADAHRWGELTASCYELDVQTRKQVLRFIAVPWRKLYRRSLLEDNAIRFPVGDAFYEDNPFHWFAVIAARSMTVVPEVLCYHRVGRTGQTMATADERVFKIFQHHDTIRTWLAGRRLLDVYETTLLGWVISQMEWIARRTPPPLRRTLFDILVPVFAEYSQPAIATALRDGNKGATAQRLSAAVSKREYASFVRTLASRPGSNNPVISAAFHLRHSGVQHTAVLAGRYVRNTLRGSRMTRTLSRAVGARGGPRPQDVMFGLTVIQHQLQGMETRLSEMQGRQVDLEHRIVGRRNQKGAQVAEAPSVTDLLTEVRNELRVTRTIPSSGIVLRQRAVEQSVDYILSDRRFDNVQVSLHNASTVDAALKEVRLDGMLAEFGVYKGTSLTQIAKFFPHRTVHGFDSFVGLPDAWGGTSKGAGAFDIGAKPPDLPVSNVEFHVGWFDDTVPVFAEQHSGPLAFAHLDADLYSSTKTVFDHLGDWFVAGTIVVFDEYFGYHGWQRHEHQAFQEFLARTGLSFEAISLGHMNVAVRLINA